MALYLCWEASTTASYPPILFQMIPSIFKVTQFVNWSRDARQCILSRYYQWVILGLNVQKSIYLFVDNIWSLFHWYPYNVHKLQDIIMTGVLYMPLSLTEVSLGYIALNQGHCWSVKWEEKAAGAEENRAWGLTVNKAAFVQRKETIIFNALRTDIALLLTQTLSALVMHVAHSLGIWSCCSVKTCLFFVCESNAFTIGNIRKSSVPKHTLNITENRHCTKWILYKTQM